MNTDGFKRWPIEPLGGSCDWDDSTQIPRGIAIIAKNCRFEATSVATRYGLQHTMAAAGDAGDITGMDVLKVLGKLEQEIPIAYGNKGFLLREFPPGAGVMNPVPIAVDLPTSGGTMRTAKAYNRVYLTVADLKKGLIPPQQLNGPDGLVTPISQNVVGAVWQEGTYYVVGDVVRTTDGTGRWFRCRTPGIASDTEPTWPTLNGYFTPGGAFQAATATDSGGSVWEEWTPNASIYVPTPQTPVGVVNNPGHGTIPAGKDVFFRCSYIRIRDIAGGFVTTETLWTPAIKFSNTSANDALTLQFQNAGEFPGPPGSAFGGPRMPRWLANWPLTLQVYASIVAHGSPEGAYRPQLGIEVGDPGEAVDTPPVFTSINTVTDATVAPNTATLTMNDNVQSAFQGETGTRYMIVLRKDSAASLSPVDPGSPIPVQFFNGFPRPVATLPPGGAGHLENIAAFTVVGQQSAGPYFYIEDDDPANPVSTRVSALSRTSATSIVSATLVSTAGFVAGQFVRLRNVDASFNGFFLLASVGLNTVTWAQSGADETASIADPAIPVGTLPNLSVDPVLKTVVGTIIGGTLQSTDAAIPLDFFDDYFSNDNDVTSQLTSMPVPKVSYLGYIPSLGKMAYVSDDFPSSVLFSETDDPGNIDGVGGELQIEPTNGARMIACLEMRNGGIVAVKENGGYGIVPGDTAPAQWGKGRLWDGHGPPNADCIGVGPDFIVFGCEDGLYKFDGNPAYCISQEKLRTWRRINWKASQPMWIEVDDEEKAIHMGVALDNADTPTQVLVLDYFKGWEPAVEKTLTGDVVTNRDARRWTDHDIDARCGKVVKRTLATPISNPVNLRQFLYGRKSTGTASVVDMTVPDVYDDSGAAIDCQYQPAFCQGDDEVLAFGGITGRVKGEGFLELTPVTEDPDFGLPTEDIDLGSDLKIKHFGKGLRARNEHLSYLITNGNQVGAWFELQEAAIWFRPIFTSRR